MKKELLGYKAPDTETPMLNNWRRVTLEYHDYQAYYEYHDSDLLKADLALLKAERRQSRITEVLAD